MNVAILIFMIINFICNLGIIACCSIVIHNRASDLKRQKKLNNASNLRKKVR